MNDYVNYYDLLNVSNNATSEEIKMAYRKKIKEWHPDKNKSTEASKISSKLNEAKEILLDEQKRKDYDYFLEQEKRSKYEKLHKKQQSSPKTYNPNTNYSTSKAYQQPETKMYTKWEYFKEYLKYYNVSKIRKIFAIIFVCLETLLCGILQTLNFILAFICVTFYDVVELLIKGAAAIYFMYNVITFISPNGITYSGGEIVKVVIVSMLIMMLSVSLPILISLMISIFPTLISKLNIKLFKISIGYKK